MPRSDEHQGEYVPARADRLAWISGFTGSAGLAIVMLDQAAIFVDGRYTLQVQAEVSPALFQYKHLTDDPHADWAASALPQSGRLGYDPWLHTVGWVDRMRSAIGRAGSEMLACPDNPIDAVWPDQPPSPLAPVVPHDLRFAGKPAAEKLADVAASLRKAGQTAIVLTQPDSIAWLLNIRGADVPHTPLPLSFAIINDDGAADLFIDRRKLFPVWRSIWATASRFAIPASSATLWTRSATILPSRCGSIPPPPPPGSSTVWLLRPRPRVERDADPIAAAQGAQERNRA